ncbi:MAG: hypothetical protein KC613_10685 [Myxococcales bacterium]|nr:hypothetical protein [Myxococcales bacterium]
MFSRLAILVLALSAAPALGQSRFSPHVEGALEDLKRTEPTIQEAQKAALAFFNVSPDTLSSMRGRAAWKAILPEVSVRYRTGLNTAESRDFALGSGLSANEPAARSEAEGQLDEIQVAGTWNLPRLLFNSEVLDVSSVAVLQEGVLKNVTRLYYTRRRLQVDLILNPPRDAASRLSKELRIEELTATLDALTGNLFSRRKRAAAARGGMGGMEPEARDRFVAP